MSSKFVFEDFDSPFTCANNEPLVGARALRTL